MKLYVGPSNILLFQFNFTNYFNLYSNFLFVFRRKLDDMISEEDLVNGKEKCYFQEKKCLTDIHNRTAMASK